MQYVNVAQLEQNIVVGVSRLKQTGFVTRSQLVVIPDYDESLIGKTYEPETGQFVDSLADGGETT